LRDGLGNQEGDGHANVRGGRDRGCRTAGGAVLRAGGAALRFGALYGPGAIDDQVEFVRKRQYPLVGHGAGYSSWLHLDDAVSATVLAVEHRATGVFNIVDDEPAPASQWLPYLAQCAAAKPPMRVPTWLARAVRQGMVP
jgi:Nucleoside-diphosphate-sugar epimerases